MFHHVSDANEQGGLGLLPLGWFVVLSTLESVSKQKV
jgi:hypothetical protein